MFVRKKPVTVEAHLLTVENAEWVAKWAKADVSRNQDGTPNGLLIFTLEGTMCGRIGDYIIKGVKGEFYPCVPDVFEQTYEDVDAIEEEKEDESFFEPSRGTPHMKITDITELDDGNLNVVFDMDYDTMKLFAQIGILKALTDSANAVIDAKKNEDFDAGEDGC